MSAPPAGDFARQDPQALAEILAQAYQQHGQPDPCLSLAQILKQETLVSLLLHMRDSAQLSELLAHLPAEHQAPPNIVEELQLTMQSPAFGQQLECISLLLQNGQLTLAQLGLEGEVCTRTKCH